MRRKQQNLHTFWNAERTEKALAKAFGDVSDEMLALHLRKSCEQSAPSAFLVPTYEPPSLFDRLKSVVTGVPLPEPVRVPMHTREAVENTAAFKGFEARIHRLAPTFALHATHDTSLARKGTYVRVEVYPGLRENQRNHKPREQSQHNDQPARSSHSYPSESQGPIARSVQISAGVTISVWP